jgi:hypothetical protein
MHFQQPNRFCQTSVVFTWRNGHISYETIILTIFLSGLQIVKRRWQSSPGNSGLRSSNKYESINQHRCHSQQCSSSSSNRCCRTTRRRCYYCRWRPVEGTPGPDLLLAVLRRRDRHARRQHTQRQHGDVGVISAALLEEEAPVAEECHCLGVVFFCAILRVSWDGRTWSEP